MTQQEQLEQLTVRLHDLGPNIVKAPKLGLGVIADVPAYVIVVPISGRPAMRAMRLDGAQGDLDGLLADIAHREDVGTEVVALMRAINAA